MECPALDLERPWYSTQVPYPEALTEMAALRDCRGFSQTSCRCQCCGHKANGATGSTQEDESPKPCKADLDFAGSAPGGLADGAAEKDLHLHLL